MAGHNFPLSSTYARWQSWIGRRSFKFWLIPAAVIVGLHVLAPLVSAFNCRSALSCDLQFSAGAVFRYLEVERGALGVLSTALLILYAHILSSFSKDDGGQATRLRMALPILVALVSVVALAISEHLLPAVVTYPIAFIVALYLGVETLTRNIMVQGPGITLAKALSGVVLALFLSGLILNLIWVVSNDLRQFADDYGPGSGYWQMQGVTAAFLLLVAWVLEHHVRIFGYPKIVLLAAFWFVLEVSRQIMVVVVLISFQMDQIFNSDPFDRVSGSTQWDTALARADLMNVSAVGVLLIYLAIMLVRRWRHGPGRSDGQSWKIALGMLVGCLLWDFVWYIADGLFLILRLVGV
ncbi:hypothetical protein RMQ97_12195 [Maricaulis sp. D1M11]|uniref:hypothetical protein n=1 Tax=Maricaulis sp. D1M11 TaxID=3076117 RepID=UPI0039B3E0EA